MKRFTLTMTMALGCLMTSQSFGFDLLDRMLGSRGCGCDTISCVTPDCGAETACCPVDPSCGAEPCLGGLFTKVGRHAAPCCDSTPVCHVDPCCDAAPCCDTGIGRGGLLSKLFNKRAGQSCCDAGCEPTCGLADPCGCATGCDSGCALVSKPRGLLSKLFSKCHTSNCCDAPCDGFGSSCGCGAPVAPHHHHAVPMIDSVPEAPAPIADPSASIQSKRHVVQASARYVR